MLARSVTLQTMRRIRVRLRCCALSSALGAEPFDVQALLKLARVTDPQVSPDGRTWPSRSRRSTSPRTRGPQIYIVPVAGGAPVRITRDGETTSVRGGRRIRKQIAFISDRGGSSQVWMMDPRRQRQARSPPLAPRPGACLFAGRQEPGFHQRGVSRVRRRRSLQQAGSRRRRTRKVKARIYTTLLYRHWNAVAGRAAQPLFVVPGRTAENRRTSRRATATCRRSRSAAPTITRFRPTAAKSAT